MPKNYRLSPQAEQNLLDIFLFGIENWGRQQTHNYANELSLCFELLAKNPEIGLMRSELIGDIRSFVSGSHVIFYRKMDLIVEIIVILHQKMDVKSKFK